MFKLGDLSFILCTHTFFFFFQRMNVNFFGYSIQNDKLNSNKLNLTTNLYKILLVPIEAHKLQRISFNVFLFFEMLIKCLFIG